MKATNELQKFDKVVNISKEQEGIVFLGCSGTIEEWGIQVTTDLIENKIASEIDICTEVFIMKSTGGRRDVVLIFNPSKVNISKMAMWRLKFGGECSWLSDFVVNYANHYPPIIPTETPKPVAKLTGIDGNIFNLIGVASRAMKGAGIKEEAKQMQNEILKCGSYDEALQLIMKYVEVE